MAEFKCRYPTFKLEDELFVEGVVMSCGAGITAATTGSSRTIFVR